MGKTRATSKHALIVLFNVHRWLRGGDAKLSQTLQDENAIVGSILPARRIHPSWRCHRSFKSMNSGSCWWNCLVSTNVSEGVLSLEVKEVLSIFTSSDLAEPLAANSIIACTFEMRKSLYC